MIKILLPLFSTLLGIAGGVAAAMYLGGSDAAVDAEVEEQHSDEAIVEEVDLETVKLPNQFVVPVITRNRVRAMVILTVALDVPTGQADAVRTAEPKLRDVFLQTRLFDKFHDLLAHYSFSNIGLILYQSSNKSVLR